MEDNQDGQGFGMGFKHWAKEYGYKIVIDEPFAPGTKDFSSHILKYKAAGVDAILTLIPPTDGITLLRQMKEQNLNVPYIHGWKGFWTREFEGAMGKLANYVIHDGFWSDKLGAPGAKDLQERFVREFGVTHFINSSKDARIFCGWFFGMVQTKVTLFVAEK